MNTLKQFFLITVASLLLMGGCATSTGKANPETVVFDLHGKYASALQIAVAYKRLPSCEVPPAPVLCAKASVVKDLQDADDIAKPVLDAAQATVRSPGVGVNVDTMIKAADEATRAMTAITSKVQTQ